MDNNDTLGGVPRYLIGEYHEATKDNVPENGIVEWLAKELIELKQVKNTVDLGSVSKRELQEYTCKTISDTKRDMKKEREVINAYSFMLGRKDYAETILMKFT